MKALLALFLVISLLLAAIFCAFPWAMTRPAAAIARTSQGED
jgi:hypothetical protein